MLSETRTASRKTPLDGKLEISPEMAEILVRFGNRLVMAIGSDRHPVRIETMSCICAKGEGKGHTHHFLESPWFKTLQEGDELRLTVDDVVKTLDVAKVMVTGR